MIAAIYLTSNKLDFFSQPLKKEGKVEVMCVKESVVWENNL